MFAFITSMTDHPISFHAPGLVLFLEEDLYLTKDTLHTLRMLDSKRTNEEDMIVMGSREPIRSNGLLNHLKTQMINFWDIFRFKKLTSILLMVFHWFSLKPY